MTDDIGIFPIKIQKIWRILKLILKLKFISSSSYLTVCDHIFYNKISSVENSEEPNDQLLASRQELFSQITVKTAHI